MPHKPDILNRSIVAKSRLFEVERLDLRFSNGELREYERLLGHTSGSVMIVPLLDNDTVLLIREYAAGLDDYILALPKGLIDAGETPEESANRELQEEVGYAANDIQLLSTLTVAPGYLSAKIHVLLAQDLYEQRLPGDEPEAIEVLPWSLSRLDELLMRDDFHEARSIAALFMVREKLQKQ